MKEITHTAILTALKKKKVDEILPELFCEMVQTAVVDLADLDKFMKNGFEKLKQQWKKKKNYWHWPSGVNRISSITPSSPSRIFKNS